MKTEHTDISWPGWETVRLIGRGSFGAVYEIQRDILGSVEKAALKVISIPQNASDIDELYSNGYDEESITNTFRYHLKCIVEEYSMMRKLSDCPNIVTCDDVHYVQHDDGIGWDIFIKMELLTPLLKSLQNPVSEKTVVKLAKDICSALVACKQYNIVHRDIKPQNIFFASSGIYKLGDFGIAKTVEKTMGGTKIGTYNYMAPEVYNNQPYGSTADIYSLGLVLYWLLNERRMPFLPLPPAKMSAGQDEAARMRRLSGEQFPEPKHGSKQLKAIVMKACAYNVADRYASASDMLKDLNQIEQVQTYSTGTVNVVPTWGEFSDNGTEPEKDYETIDGFREEDTYETIVSDPGEKDKTVNLGIEVNKTGEATVCDDTLPSQEDDEEALPTSDPPSPPRPLKRYYISGAALAALAVLVFVFWPRHIHMWEVATCYQPKTCSECKETEGTPLEHIWSAADCITPKTCKNCAKTEGKPLGHSFTEASCTSPVFCTECGTIIKEALNHEWVEATFSSPKICSVCQETEGVSRTEQIIAEAKSFADAEQYRYAIEMLDKAWKESGDRTFVDLAAEYRMAFGMHANTIFAAGKFNTILLNTNGGVTVYGNNEFKEHDANIWTDIIAASAGDRHVVGLQSDGRVMAKGDNKNGQCEVEGWRDVIAISAGDVHTVGLIEDGTIITCGNKYFGQRDVTLIMNAAGSRRIVAVAAGYVHTLALLEDGRVLACGSNDDGACIVSGWTDIAAIYAGTKFSAGLRSDGTVVVTKASWDVSGWNDIIALAAGDYFLLGLRADGTVVSVGDVEKKPDVSGWRDIVCIAAGHDHAVAIDSEGYIHNAGSNAYGQYVSS